MGAKDNADVIRRGYDAFNAGDLTTLATIFNEGVRWHVAGPRSDGGRLRRPGRDVRLLRTTG